MWAMIILAVACMTGWAWNAFGPPFGLPLLDLRSEIIWGIALILVLAVIAKRVEDWRR